MKDVARHSGLSITTVSKYVNGGNVLEENRVLLEKVIKKLGFEVNLVARGLKKNQTMMVGVIVPNFESQFFMSMISNIENSLMRYGYSTIVCDYRHDLSIEVEKIKLLYGKKVDGIILSPSPENIKIYRDVLARGISMVFIDTIVDGLSCDAVVVDNRESVRNVTQDLIKKGHRGIGLVVMGHRERYTAKERIAGYLQAHAEAGIGVNAEHIVEGPVSFEGGRQAMAKLLQTSPRITAGIVMNDEMTLGSLQAIHRVGLKIPRDISLVGFDMNDIARAFDPELATIIQPLGEIGETAASLLINRLRKEGRSAERLVQLKTSFEARGSIGTCS